MKKSFLTLCAVIMALSLNATDIWTGEQYVTWGQGLQIASTQFANAKAGDKIVVTYTGATKGIEFKVKNANSDHLAGSREAAEISGDGTFEQFLTKTAVDSLQAHGLEIIGENFTCKKVELNDGKTLKAGFTVWTGYFWADSWTTLELYWNGYAGVDWSKATALRIYSEANRSDFVINIKESWEKEGQIADQNAMNAGEGYMELELTAELRTRLANAGHWMIQFNKESGAAFNVTDVVLVINDGPATAIEQTNADAKATKIFRNGMLVIEKNGKFYNALGVEVK